MRVEEEDFSSLPIWVQIWGLPKLCKMKELGEKIGGRIGELLESCLFNVQGRENRIIKVSIKLDASKTLKSQLKIASSIRGRLKSHSNMRGWEFSTTTMAILAMKTEHAHNSWRIK